jgi:hypothetical protein
MKTVALRGIIQCTITTIAVKITNNIMDRFIIDFPDPNSEKQDQTEWSQALTSYNVEGK